MATLTFQRREKKFVIDENQKEALIALISKKMAYDKHCEGGKTYLVRNVYYDTTNYDLISKSVRKPKFKEKLRVRKYGTINDNKDQYFLEIKRKVLGIVSKRRVAMNKLELDDFLNKKIIPLNRTVLENQVFHELSYFLSVYEVQPKVFLSYERLGFFDKENPKFRLTLDNKLFVRHHDFDFDNTNEDRYLLPEGKYIMEVKIENAMPLWFSEILSELKIYKTSFSKYGTDYKYIVEERSL